MVGWLHAQNAMQPRRLDRCRTAIGLTTIWLVMTSVGQKPRPLLHVLEVKLVIQGSTVTFAPVLVETNLVGSGVSEPHLQIGHVCTAGQAAGACEQFMAPSLL